MKIIVIGGVAGGASAAARLRRLDEHAEILLLEKGDHISYANCGLPYYIGDVIKEKDRLLVQTPDAMRTRFNLDIRTKSEVLSIDRGKKQVAVRDLRDGNVYREDYDKLILSPGAEPKRLDMDGLDLEGVFTLRTIPDTYRIRDYVDEKKPQRAVVIGGGFIGVEMAENLYHRGLEVSLVEFTDQVVASLDAEMAAFLHQHMRLKGMNLLFRTGATGFYRQNDGSLQVRLNNGQVMYTDLIIFSIGVAPDNRLAREAGLALGIGGSIKVDKFLFTSDPYILAVGDAIEVEHFVTGSPALIPLAGPANKQGRIAAENALGARVAYEGSQGSAVLKVFDMTAASTGLNEKQLLREEIKYEKTYVHPLNHAGYYPGATQMTLKMLFDPQNGRILGAQGVGIDGVEKRIDVLATAQRLGATVSDLEKLELTYAPSYSSAKDPVNMLGFTASNFMKGDAPIFHYHDVDDLDLDRDLLIDVRKPEEQALGGIQGAVSIPLEELRSRLADLPGDRKIYIYCQVGIRGYLATRLLQQNGFANVYNLSGGYRLYHTVMLNESAEIPYDCFGQPLVTGEGEELVVSCPLPEEIAATGKIVQVDATGLQCPGPVLKLAQAMKELQPGDLLHIRVTDPGFASDVGVWCERTGNTLENLEQNRGEFTAKIKKGGPAGKKPAAAGNDKSIIVFSGDLDKAIASLIIANGAASMGRQVTMFYTFWGLNILRKSEKVKARKNIVEKMFGLMMPRGSKKLGLSRMNMGGMGRRMIRAVMRSKNISSLEELIQTALDNGVRMIACQMSMDVMGIKAEELIDGVEIGGVATYIGAAELADTNLFI